MSVESRTQLAVRSGVVQRAQAPAVGVVVVARATIQAEGLSVVTQRRVADASDALQMRVVTLTVESYKEQCRVASFLSVIIRYLNILPVETYRLATLSSHGARLQYLAD